MYCALEAAASGSGWPTSSLRGEQEAAEEEEADDEEGQEEAEQEGSVGRLARSRFVRVSL